MIRGITAPFTFKLPYPKSQIDWIVIKFWQDGNSFTPITRKYEATQLENDTTGSEYELFVRLTSAETKKFSDKRKAKVQLAACLKDGGARFGSHPQLITVYPIRDDLIVDDPMDDVGITEDGWKILDAGEIGTSGGGV